MSTSIAAPVYAARKPNKRSSRTAISPNLFGAAAIGCLVLGAGWTVYSNIFAASVYPMLDSARYDEPVTKRAAKVAMRDTSQAVKDVFAALPEQTRPVEKRPAVVAITREMFDQRFAAAAPQGVPSNAASAAPPAVATNVAEAKGAAKDAAKPGEPARIAAAPKPQERAKIADAAKAKRATAAPVRLASNEPAQTARADEAKPAKSGFSVRDMAERAKAAVLSIGSGDKQAMVEKLWGKSSGSALLAYASADASATGSIGQKEQNPMLGGSPPYDRSTAVYDISRKMVYLPDGTRLEAHSGLGSNLDDPRSARVRMRGVTPPHIYELKPREALFHGVPALRLTPIGGEGAIYGRDGLLAHTYMLGPNGDSNGCVSFKDYYAFLEAYRSKGIRKLAVLARIE